jgi:hypothetical protein
MEPIEGIENIPKSRWKLVGQVAFVKLLASIDEPCIVRSARYAKFGRELASSVITGAASPPSM